ncbi:DUF937 domain-containing protein [Burkholderia sp. AW33-5]
MAPINLLQSLESLLTEPIAQQAPAFLTESRTSVVNGVGVALSNLLGAVVRFGTTANGVDSLLRVLSMPNVDPSLLTQDLAGMFAGGAATHKLIDLGKSQLELLFGANTEGFNAALAEATNLASKHATLLTGMVIPFVLASIKQAATRMGPLEPSVLGTVLDTQSQHLDGRLSEKLLGVLGLGGLAGWLGAKNKQLGGEIRPNEGNTNRAAVAAKHDVNNRTRIWTLLGLLLLALLALLSLGFCMKRTPNTAQPTEIAASSTATTMAKDAASAVTDVIPKGAGVIAGMLEGKPALKVFFDFGKADLPVDFTDKVKDVLTYLKDNPSSRVSVSGFTDSSGDPTLNAELARKRAESVKAGLLATGIDGSRVSLDKPASVSGDTPDAGNRRVEIHVQ